MDVIPQGLVVTSLQEVAVVKTLLTVGMILGLVIGGGPVRWDGAGVPVLLACALGVVIVAAVGALPLSGRRIDPELIRRD
ncbi:MULTISPECIES: hypothetical protein [unclassified Streptomyces]|uniref:hypothetical protein n=1 Tax=unclassified Streptomyces TaxID=2593676 RepID=UPI0033B6B20C|nr:hypothetical protein OG199_28050 [Streptomyces sp. NBC_01176]